MRLKLFLHWGLIDSSDKISYISLNGGDTLQDVTNVPDSLFGLLHPFAVSSALNFKPLAGFQTPRPVEGGLAAASKLQVNLGREPRTA